MHSGVRAFVNSSLKAYEAMANKKLQDQAVAPEEKGIEEGFGMIGNLSGLKEQGFETGEQSLI